MVKDDIFIVFLNVNFAANKFLWKVFVAQNKLLGLNGIESLTRFLIEGRYIFWGFLKNELDFFDVLNNLGVMSGNLFSVRPFVAVGVYYLFSGDG